MEVARALRKARLAAHLTQRQLGGRISYNDRMVSMVELGGREMAPDCALAAARLLDDADLDLALAEEATGGVMVAIALDGPKVDLNRLATGRKLVEEAGEALEIWGKAKSLINCRSADDLDDEARDEVLRFCHHVAELMTCAGNTLRVMADTYGLSPRQIYREHVAELVDKGFATPRREGRRNAATA